MKTEKLKIISRHFNMAVDAYMVMGRVKNKNADRPYIVGWKSRHNEDVIETRDFKNEKRARRAFNKAVKKNDIPETTDFQNDYQQQRLYDWETKYLDKLDRKVGKKEAKELVVRVAADYGIEPPKIKWHKDPKETTSTYDENDHLIEMGYGQNYLITVLHEMAHALDSEHNEDESAPNHGPAFAWKAIELYHAYAGFDLSYLITTANHTGLLGDIMESQHMPVTNLRLSK